MKEEKEENENLYKNKKIFNEKQIDSKCLTYLSKKKKQILGLYATNWTDHPKSIQTDPFYK